MTVPSAVEERQFRDIVEAASEGVWLIDADGAIVYANEALAQMLAVPVEQMLGRRFVDFVHPEDRDASWRSWSSLTARERRHVERRFLRSDGTVLAAVVGVSAITGFDGRPGRAIALVRDVTEQNRAQEALRESERKHRQIVETANEGILSFGIEREILFVNESMARMLGYTAAEMIGRPLLDLIAPEELSQMPACLDRSMQGQAQRYERQLRRKDGGTVWSLVSSTPTYDASGALTSVLCMVTDISEQKHAEHLARQHERQFREIVETANEGIWVVDAEARLRYVNDSLLRTLDVSQDEMIGRSMFDFVIEADLDDARESWERTRSGIRSRVERRLRRRDGSTVWVIAGVTPRLDPAGRFTGALTMITDITERKRAEMALQDSRKALEEALNVHRRILECSLDVICTFNDKGEFIEVSDNCETMWGYKPEELIGRRAVSMIHPDDVARTMELVEEVRAGRRRRDFRNRYIRKDGTAVPVLWSAMWSPEDGKAFAVAHDLTDWEQAEEKLQHFEKMKAIGQLTGGVAHDFNNLLTVILGNASIFLDELEQGHRLRPLAETTRRAAERGADLTARLLAFSRRQPLQPQAVDLNGLVEHMVAMLHRTLGETVAIELLLAEHLRPAWVDPSQLETALLNLAINARDAMPGGGRLTIQTGNVDIEAGHRSTELSPGAYVSISVADTGTGMQPEVAARAVEPFFTTKEPGKGSGLGLSMVYGFAKQSGGHARIDTAPGAGTAVHLFLPSSSTSAAEDTEATDGELPDAAGSETVLVVEDDELVRAYVESQLYALGYRVISAVDAREALAVLARPVPVDLLFTDVVMPGGMNGRQLATAAQQARPGLKVLLTTGYAKDAILHGGRLEEGVQLLTKPYGRNELAQKVRAALTSERGDDAQPSG